MVRWWPVRLGFYCQDPHALRWFHAHWHRTAQIRTGTAPSEQRIAGLVNPRLRARLAEGLAVQGSTSIPGHIETTYLRGSLDGLPVWVSETGQGPGNEHVIVRIDDADWAVIADNAEATGRFAVRVGRELLRSEGALRGGVTVHASCATVAGRTVLFLGASGRGKTTLSLAASRHGGFLVSGDQTELLAEGGETVAVGFPWVPRLGHGTLAGFGLEHVVEDAPLLRRQEPIVDRRIADEAKGYGSRLKIELTLTELEVLLGAYTTDAAPLHAVVILDLDECVRVHQADRADVLPLFRAELREPDPAFPTWWLDSDGRVPTEPRSFDDLLDLVDGRPLLRAGWHPARHEATRIIDLLATRLG